MDDLTAIGDLLAGETPVTWVFAGDSIVQAARWTAGARGYAELFSERVRYECGRSMDAVINTGVSGWRGADLAAHLDHVVLRHAPDVTVIGVGTNDAKDHSVAEFRAVMTPLLDRVREAGSRVVLQTPVPGAVAAIPAYAEAIRELAAERGAALVDHHARWQEADSRWYGDPVHPNAEGHRVMAGTLIDALGVPERPIASDS
ncbi:lysophospholipase L1-like esterase [Nonomuraea fuscirosea]|uniref:Lysophospholipase L1-like esterase n=1 Tax=Nonomuraea fuscirosea TaxID=1291556 RepID=A0A2T0MVR9_9ACTN|nr:GDSL-type esterase/lipase family protein [Nonomuraea fuscirosea]PRX63043.1 lysophospholipase L1-like esterase [Nonomuraea fuscirosea]